MNRLAHCMLLGFAGCTLISDADILTKLGAEPAESRGVEFAASDEDRDGFTPDAGDCDEADDAVNPDAPETWYDGVDQDCSGGSDFDRDGDGWDNLEYGGLDCDDKSGAVNPEADEVCDNGVDDDCDGEAVGCAPTSGSLAAAVEVTGGSSAGYAGFSVAGAGDVNADGYDDLLIGAYRDDEAGTYAGGGYLVLGAAVPVASSLVGAVKFTGEAASNYAGCSVSGVGDVDDDGYEDMLFGAYANSDAASGAGSAYLVLGSRIPKGGSLAEALQYTGEGTSNSAGRGVAGAGDVNGDGFADFLVGASGNDDAATDAGAAYLVLGSARPADASLAAAVQYQGEMASDFAGFAVAGAGDVDGDGNDDMLIGAPYNDDGASGAGAAYLVMGTPKPLASTLSAAVEYRGEVASDAAGYSVSAAGDFNADGYGDLVVGAPNNDHGGSAAGAAYVILGSVSPASSTLGTAIEYRGEVAADQAGWSVARAGDVDWDGYDDILVGTYANDDAATNAGAAYLVLGSGAPPSVSLATVAEFTGEDASDLAGYAVGGAGDVNADGHVDLLVGAHGSRGGIGAAYLILGTGL